MSMKPEEVLRALAPWIEKHRRTTRRPEVRSDDPAPTGSAFSGLPLLRPGEDWPMCHGCQLPMELLLQLDLAELPEERHGTGVLQLFYCVSEDPCDRGWEPFADVSSLCRVIDGDEARPATTNLNRFPAKSIVGWTGLSDSPDPAEHDRLGLRFDYHFRDVPFQPMEFWCDELGVHFVGAPYIDYLQEHVAAADGDKLGGWPRWVQGVEYPTCPECGAVMALVMQLDSEDNIPYMFGDCGTGHITQCPHCQHVVAFGWACS